MHTHTHTRTKREREGRERKREGDKSGSAAITNYDRDLDPNVICDREQRKRRKKKYTRDRERNAQRTPVGRGRRVRYVPLHLSSRPLPRAHTRRSKLHADRSNGDVHGSRNRGMFFSPTRGGGVGRGGRGESLNVLLLNHNARSGRV